MTPCFSGAPGAQASTSAAAGASVRIARTRSTLRAPETPPRTSSSPPLRDGAGRAQGAPADDLIAGSSPQPAHTQRATAAAGAAQWADRWRSAVGQGSADVRRPHGTSPALASAALERAAHLAAVERSSASDGVSSEPTTQLPAIAVAAPKARRHLLVLLLRLRSCIRQASHMVLRNGLRPPHAHRSS